MYLQRRFLKFSLRVMTNPEQPLPSLYKILSRNTLSLPYHQPDQKHKKRLIRGAQLENKNTIDKHKIELRSHAFSSSQPGNFYSAAQQPLTRYRATSSVPFTTRHRPSTTPVGPVPFSPAQHFRRRLSTSFLHPHPCSFNRGGRRRNRQRHSFVLTFTSRHFSDFNNTFRVSSP